jgi:uncharacterized membrane protein
MSQYPGAQPPGGPYYGPPPSDPYGQPPAPQVDPYFGQPVADPYAPQAQYQAWQAQQAYAQQPYQQQAYPQGHQQPVQQASQSPSQAPAPPAGYWQPPPAAPAEPATRSRSSGRGGAVVGLLLVAFGAWMLFRDQISIDLGETWPVIAVGVGVLMIIGAFIPRRGG